MKKNLIQIFSVLALFALAIILALIYANEVSWKELSKKDSPNGSYSLYHYHYMSDTDRHAPYGNYIFLQAEDPLTPTKDSYVIFAGYCQDKLSYSWLSNNEVLILCKVKESKDIRTSSNLAYGININVQSE